MRYSLIFLFILVVRVKSKIVSNKTKINQIAIFIVIKNIKSLSLGFTDDRGGGSRTDPRPGHEDEGL